jgi:hypothetical protein
MELEYRPRAQVERRHHQNRNSVIAWLGLIGAPIACGADQLLSYSAVNRACAGSYLELHIWTVAALLLDLLSLLAASHIVRTNPEIAKGHDNPQQNSLHWLGAAGMFVSVVFLLLIVALELPKWMVSPCSH